MERTLHKLTRFDPLIYLLVVSIMFVISPKKQLSAQVFEPSIGLGLTSYIGDLPSYEFSNGIDILFGGAVNGSIKSYLSPYFDIRGDILFTMLRGDDAISASGGVNERNLSFRSPVIQVDIKAEWNVLGFIPGDNSYRLSPFLSAGVGAFRFNPQALYQGSWVHLQPLGTEGQGLDLFPEKEPYKRVQFVIPLGGGVKVNLADGITLTIEGILHLTMTDYLDDVGGTSVTYPVLLEESGALTAALANRTGEYLGTDPIVIPTGIDRANPDTNDSYFTGLISIGYAFQGGSNIKTKGRRLRCPKF